MSASRKLIYSVNSKSLFPKTSVFEKYLYKTQSSYDSNEKPPSLIYNLIEMMFKLNPQEIGQNKPEKDTKSTSSVQVYGNKIPIHF